MDTKYLEPGFDPSSLKVAQLRRILTENGVEFQSQAKKNTLLGLFNEHVKPKIPKLRRRYENLLPSDKGIVTVGTVNKKKKKKKNKLESNPSGSENYEADINASKSDTLDPSAHLKESTPFSDVNEFQQSSGSNRKARKRKVTEESNVKDAEGDLEMDMKVEETDKKRRRKIGEGDHTPITDKVARKTTKKSPHRSLTIDKFESSSSSDSSFNESSILNVSRRDQSGHLSVEVASPKNDFSYGKRTLAPDLTKLKVSPAFEEELKMAYKESSVPVLAGSDSHSGQDKEYASGPADVSLEKNESSISVTPVRSEPASEEEVVLSKATVSKEEVAPRESSTEELDKRISTPELITEQDVQESDDRVKHMQEVIDDINEKAQETPRRSYPKITSFFKSLATTLQALSIFFLVMTPIIYGLWYREQRVLVGYCGHEIESSPSLDFESPILAEFGDLLEAQKPRCLPCPDHAICYPYMKMKCGPEYTLQPNRWSLHGLIPLSDACVKDSRREKLIGEVVKKSLEFLRTKNAQHSCGEGKDDLKSGMTEEELYQIFYESRAPWINDEEFDELWAQAVADLIQEPEITWRQVSNIFFESNLISRTLFTNDFNQYVQLSNGRFEASDSPSDDTETNGLQRAEGHLPQTNGYEKNRVFRSTSKKYNGLRCRFEREISNTYHRFSHFIWTVITISILIKLISYKIRKYYKQREAVDHISKKVIIRLKAAKKQQQGANFLSTVQLRDVLLADITDLKRKNSMWQRVVRILENNNTNVKSSLMEIHGEIMKCWEWVGPVESEPNNEEREHGRQQE